MDPEVSLQVARRAHEGGKKVILDPGPVRPVVPEFYTYCSVITPNETEAQALFIGGWFLGKLHTYVRMCNVVQ